MTKHDSKDFTLTISGYEFDKELSRVPIKVFPALQALIANQHDLIAICKQHAPEEQVFLENHTAELNMVEETIAMEHGKYRARKEEQKKRRQEKEKEKQAAGKDQLSGTDASGVQEFDQILADPESLLDGLAAAVSPGLPSARLEGTGRRPGPEKSDELDVRRIAVGASIKALSSLLDRQLTEQEIAVIERQVDSYL